MVRLLVERLFRQGYHLDVSDFNSTLQFLWCNYVSKVIDALVSLVVVNHLVGCRAFALFDFFGYERRRLVCFLFECDF